MKEEKRMGRRSLTRKGAILGSALGMAAVLAGCGAAGEEAEGGKVKLRFATWDTAEDIDRQQGFVDEFNASQDEILVSLEAYGSEYDTKISAGMGAGDAPDIMYMWNYPAYEDGLEPLDSYIEAAGGEAFKEKFHPTLWNYNSLDGVTYGVPVGFTSHVLFYNKDLLTQAGVEEPDGTWTWEDLKEAARTVAEKTDAKGFAFQMKPDPYDFEMYLWSNGTAYCDEDGNLQGWLNSEQSKEVFEMFQEMEREGYAVATEKNGTEEFRSGAAAMYVCASWPVAELDKDGMNYGVARIPSFEKGTDSASILTSSGVAISESCKHKEEAWKFIEFYSEKEYAKGYNEMNTEGLEAFLEMLDSSDGYVPASFKIENWSEVSEDLQLAFEEMFNPSSMKDVSEALDAAAGQET